MSAEVARPRQLAPIEHPISRIGNPQNLDVKGFSRDGNRITESRASSGRPLANEGNYEKRRAESRRSSRQGRLIEDHQPRIEAIPEGVEVVKADPGKTTLPLFGSKSQLENRSFSRLSQTSRDSQKRRLEIDELEHLLKEKGKHGFNEIKKRFIANDPEQKGNVSKEGLQKILVDMLKRPITFSQLEELLTRLSLEKRRIISYTEFGSRFRDVSSPEQPRYVDPVQRHWQERGALKANDVHEHLKEKARQNVLDVTGIIPQHNPDGSRYILRPEFKNVLNSLGLHLDTDEFDKLWKRYDPLSRGTIDGKYLMKELGIDVGGGPIDTGRSRESSRSNLLKRESDRQRSIDIEKWLKRKFREGFNQMKKDFEDKDKDCIDIVTHKDFITVLRKYGLNLELEYLDEFLARCSIEPKKAGVPYKEFLLKFQDRSEEGMSHQILTNTNHKYNRPNSPSNLSSLSAIEARLLSYFQKDFLALLGTFHKIDKLSQDIISQEEFRAAIESRFNIEMTDEQYRLFIDKVPLDDEGNVKYAEFLAQFDTEGPGKAAPSLFGPKRAVLKKYKPVGVLPSDPTPPPSGKAKPVAKPIGALPRDPSPPGEEKHLIDEDEHESLLEIPREPRSDKELFIILKDLMKNRYQDVERIFFELDEQNTRRMSQETLYQLLKKLKIDPTINRAEIRSIWKSLITNTDNTLDFLQFARHFGYSLKSAAFPNAKIQPPRKGDSDLMMRSRKLNCAADMLMDSLRSKIDYMWEDIRREFEIMDPYKTGLVSKEEFRDVMTELCVHLSNYELELLTKKYATGDGRVSYVELLKPFALKRQVWRHGNNMLSLLQFPPAEADVYRTPQRGMDGVTAKLRQKLSSDWKTLRQAFRKLDTNKTGYLTLAEFKSVLKLVNVILDEEEIYQIMTEFDENLSGKIPYKQFMNKALPEASMSRMSSRQSFASSRKSANF